MRMIRPHEHLFEVDHGKNTCRKLIIKMLRCITPMSVAALIPEETNYSISDLVNNLKRNLT